MKHPSYQRVKELRTSQNVKVVMDRETGNIEVYAQKDVVEEVEDPMLQVSLEEAKAINPVYQIGDVVDFVVTPKTWKNFSADSKTSCCTEIQRS